MDACPPPAEGSAGSRVCILVEAYNPDHRRGIMTAIPSHLAGTGMTLRVEPERLPASHVLFVMAGEVRVLYFEFLSFKSHHMYQTFELDSWCRQPEERLATSQFRLHLHSIVVV